MTDPPKDRPGNREVSPPIVYGSLAVKSGPYSGLPVHYIQLKYMKFILNVYIIPLENII